MHACAARSWCPVCFACVLCDCVFLYILFFSSLFCALFILRFVFFLLNQSRSRRFRGRHIVGIRSFVYCVEPFFIVCFAHSFLLFRQFSVVRLSMRNVCAGAGLHWFANFDGFFRFSPLLFSSFICVYCVVLFKNV